ncbi:MAG TPA: hypothetical protein VLM37_09100, partial [Fibrobacteraceae bacterium]|nr:hypothetical protein [Fibrobacteraceae bacterium]
WLIQLLGTFEAFPQASIVGAKILDPLPYKQLQFGDTNLGYVDEQQIRLTAKHTSEMDLGQLDYIRPCLNVMGCCHLFKNEALYDIGEFDVRFSPSQVDDIEHNLRGGLKGHQVVYNGFLEVVHHQKTGKQSILSRAAKGNVDGNVIKMSSKYETAQAKQLKLQKEEESRQFLRQCRRSLQDAGLLNGVPEVPYDIF